jgi:glycosidase
MLDAQFDFNVYDDALAVLIRPGQSFSRLDASLKESLRFYGSHNLMGYISGNQDRGRFTSYAGGDLLFDEDPKLAGWTREIGVGDPAGYSITGLLFAFNMTIPGLPVIYYGDEIGMAGGNDPDCRRMMRFENLNAHEHLLREKVKKLSSLRRNNLPLIYGDFESLQVSPDTYAYCRSYFDELAVVALNKSGEQKNIIFELPHRFEGEGLQGHFGSEFSTDGATVSIALEPLSFEVLTFK